MDAASSRTDVACANCGSDDRVVLYPAGVAQVHQIVQCAQCDLMYASPRLQMVTNQDEWDKDEIEEVAQDLPHRIEKEELQLRDHRSTRAFLAQHYPQRGKLLEVGSSFGFLLDYMRQDGWDVLGIEPDPRLAKHAREMHNVEVIAELAEDAGIADNSMDVIIMLHVIEHVPDPVGLLQELYRMLKPGGHLVLETPRYDSLMYKLFGKRERSLSCNGHILFYTVDSLKYATDKAGFQLEKYDLVGRSMTADRLAWNVAVMSKINGLKDNILPVLRKLGLNKIRFTLNTHDMQRFYLRKPV